MPLSMAGCVHPLQPPPGPPPGRLGGPPGGGLFGLFGPSGLPGGHAQFVQGGGDRRSGHRNSVQGGQLVHLTNGSQHSPAAEAVEGKASHASVPTNNSDANGCDRTVRFIITQGCPSVSRFRAYTVRCFVMVSDVSDSDLLRVIRGKPPDLLANRDLFSDSFLRVSTRTASAQ